MHFTPARNELKSILDNALAAVAPDRAVARHLRVDGDRLFVNGLAYELGDYERIVLIGAGKGAAPMAAEMERLLGERLDEGLVCVKYGHTMKLDRVRLLEGDHPVPDENGRKAAEEILRLAGRATRNDLVICVFTGGASALSPSTHKGVSLEDMRTATGLLLDCGATIHEINSIRKHLSTFGGGQLAREAAPATLVALIVSDVVGDDLDVIASGPTSPDTTSFQDCLACIGSYGLERNMPASVMRRLLAGARGERKETPKGGDAVFRKVHNCLVATNTQALEAAASAARELGMTPQILTSEMTGEARVRAREFVRECLHRQEKLAEGERLCLLCGGETTVTIHGEGLGGRNQEMALAAVVELAGHPGISMLFAGTDGTDGPTDAAGGFADSGVHALAQELGADPVDYLGVNDSYHFLERTGALLKTGPTLTNVMDLAVAVVEKG